MNKEKALLWKGLVEAVLSNRNLVTVQQRFNGVLEVRTKQKFDKAYIVEYESGECSLAICDTYGVMTGAENWSINPDLRTITAKTTNGMGEPISFLWTVDENERDEIWREMQEWQQKVWA